MTNNKKATEVNLADAGHIECPYKMYSKLHQSGGVGVDPNIGTIVAGYDTLAALCSLPEAEQKLIFLSGTPMKAEKSSLFGQLHLLRPSLLRARAPGDSSYDRAAAAVSYEALGERYCSRKDDDNGVWSGEKPLRSAELSGYLQNHVMVRRLKADVMAAKKQTDVWEPVAGREGDHEALHHANYIMSRLGGNFAANNAVDALDVATYSADFAEVRHVLQDLGVEGWAASLDVWTRLHEEAAAAATR